MEYTSIVISLALLQYIYFMFAVGGARGKYGVKAPSCSGNEEFEKHFRVHQNTLEQLLVFIPGMFLFAHYINPVWGAGIGLVFIIGRFIYAYAYINNPDKRAPGMLLSFFPNVILVLGGIIGAIMKLI